MRTPPVTCFQIENAFKLLAKVCEAPEAERAAYFPLTTQALTHGYNAEMIGVAEPPSAEWLAQEIADHVRSMPRCFALLECWLADNPKHIHRAGLFNMALAGYISGEPGLTAYAPLRTALPIAIRACLDDAWR
ncbi:MAG: hypothetical protein WBH52_28280 [Pseudomonas aeruginosa]